MERIPQRPPLSGSLAAIEGMHAAAVGSHPTPNAYKYCVYNQTRGHFVATDVTSADASVGGVQAGLRNLGQEFGTGLWILPDVRISPNIVCFPLDLVYLDNDCVVLATVEAFPLTSPPVSSARIGSVLALPVNTVAKAEVHVGDRLIVCAPEEMMLHLQSVKTAKVGVQKAPSPFLEEFLLPSAGEQTGPAAEESLDAFAGYQPPVAGKTATARGEVQRARPPFWEEFLLPSAGEHPGPAAEAPRDAFAGYQPSVAGKATKAKVGAQRILSPFLEEFLLPSAGEHTSQAPEEPQEASAGFQPPVADEAATEEVENHAAEAPEFDVRPLFAQFELRPQRKIAEQGSWFTRLLSGHSVDQRDEDETQEALPGLVAHFFTGGAPTAHAVRDISTRGLFVITEQRWYPGTVVQITLTDRHNPNVERSITVNATAVRCGDDGVRLEFVLERKKGFLSLTPRQMELTGGTDPSEIKEFLRVYKTPPRL